MGKYLGSTGLTYLWGKIKATFAKKSDIPAASTTAPVMDGVATVGSSTAYARADHKHPSDTTKAEKIAEINHGTSDTTFALTPNIHHVWGEVTSLTLTLATGESGIVNEYMFSFYSGSTPTTLTLPSTVKWVQPLTCQQDKYYEVSILNNLAAYLTDNMVNT